MTDLNQQLEDKKKGCGKLFEDYKTKCGDLYKHQRNRICPVKYCRICQAEIAILEQAIAEIKTKERKIKTVIDKLYNMQEGVREYHLESDEEFAEGFFKDMGKIITELQQLNQPKTEQ